MSQLGFVDVFDMARESIDSCCITQDAETSNGYFPSVHRLMSAQYSRSHFISAFRSTGCHLRCQEMFSDFLVLTTSELDMARTKAPENAAHCQKIYDRYTIANIEDMNEMSSLMVCALKAKFHDFFGAIFMELELGDDFHGQYSIPHSIQHLMICLLIPGIQDTTRRGGIMTVSNPASGTAGMLTAYAECLFGVDVNSSQHMFDSRIDIDPVAADMAFIQLPLLGIAVEMVTGNTLAVQLNRMRHTPMCYFNNFEKYLSDLNQHRVTPVFIRGLSDVTQVIRRTGDNLHDCCQGPRACDVR